jgi:N-acetylmuramoyl-L-alanine amidase
MPYLTNLADIARGAGLRVVEQAGWRTRGHGPQTGVKTIVCHHTAGAATGNAPSLNVVQNGRPDLDGPLSHFLLARDGTVFVVAAGQCWHTGATWQTSQSNAYAIGIEAEATGTAAWPPEQMDAYARLCKALCVAFGLGVDRVQGHKEVCSPAGRKTDPNFDMTAFRVRVTHAGTTERDWFDMATPQEIEAAVEAGVFNALSRFVQSNEVRWDGSNWADCVLQTRNSVVGLQAQGDETNANLVDLIEAVKANGPAPQ